MKQFFQKALTILTRIFIFLTAFILWIMMEMMYDSKYGTLGVYDLGNHYKIKNEREDIGSILIYLFNKKTDLFMMTIANWKYDDKFIILMRFPAEDFYCFDNTTNDYTKYEFTHLWDLEYIIIDKNNGNMYATYDINKFLEKSTDLGLKISFDPNEKLKLKEPGLAPVVYKNSAYYQYLRTNCIKKDEYKNMFYY